MDIVSNNNVMDDRSQYIYYAFISYQRKDEKWAKWLQRKLENYKLPVANAKDASDKKSKYIRPVFRDKTDLTTGPLPDALKEALQQSRYLIVICSPNAVESPWVNEEIETFTKAGRTEFVIPFIVNGEPYSKDGTNECFPDALKAIPKEQELLGVNIGEGGKERAFIRTVAYMLGVKFDELWNRYERHRRKMRNIAIACLAFLAVIALGFYDYTRTKVEYYADWVDVNGIPHGIIPLSTKQVNAKNNCYRFEYKRVPLGETNSLSWRLYTVNFVNSFGRLIDGDVSRNRSSKMKIHYYKTSGEVSQIDYMDRYGKVKFRHKYTSPDNSHISCVIDIVKSIEERGEGFARSNLIEMPGNNDNFSKINRFVLTRKDGLIIKQSFHYGNSYEIDSTITCDANGVFAKEMRLDSLGRCVQVIYLNRNESVTKDKQGISKLKYDYDNWSNIVQISCFDIDNKLKKCRQGWAIKKCRADNNGNIVQISYFDEQLSPCTESNGIASCINKYDQRGNIIQQSYFDTHGNPTIRIGGYASITRGYDKYGILVEQWYKDEKGNFVSCRDNYAGAIIKNDKYGNKIEIQYYNQDKELCLTKDSIAILKQKFDDYGNLIEQRYFGIDGKPRMCNAGYAGLTNKYDEEGRRIEGIYYDIDGNIHESEYYGYARLENNYDIKGNWVATAYFDSKGKPVLRRNMNARKEMRYNDNGLVIEEKFYDAGGNLSNGNDGYCKTKYEYDKQGNLIREAHFDLDDKPAICIFCKNASKTYKYDDDCNLIEEAYFDAEGKPCNYKKGYSKIVYSYDSYGTKIDEKKYDKDGGLVEVGDDLASLLMSLFN